MHKQSLVVAGLFFATGLALVLYVCFQINTMLGVFVLGLFLIGWGLATVKADKDEPHV